MDLSGSVALVTGGSGGLGRKICKSLAENGVSVAVGFLDGSERANDVCREISADGGKAITVQFDQSDEDSVDRAVHAVVEKLGSLDILVNNAAMAKGVPFPDLDCLVTGAMGHHHAGQLARAVACHKIGRTAPQEIGARSCCKRRSHGWLKADGRKYCSIREQGGNNPTDALPCRRNGSGGHGQLRGSWSYGGNPAYTEHFRRIS